MDPVLPSFAFRLVRLPEKPQYMLEVTTTLDPLRRILAFYFCSQLPEPLKKTWRFEYSHPALNGSFTHEGVTWNSSEIQVLPFFDNKRHRLNLKVEKNPKFKGLREEDCFMILYIMLSDAIGETAVEALSGITAVPGRHRTLENTRQGRVSLDQLAALLHQECHNRGWIDPDDIVFIAKNYTYRTRKLTLRQDITEGVSFCLPLLNEEGRSASQKPSTALGQRSAGSVLQRCRQLPAGVIQSGKNGTARKGREGSQPHSQSAEKRHPDQRCPGQRSWIRRFSGL